MRSNIADKCIYYILNSFSKSRKTVFVSQKIYLWNNKPIREKSVLLWDLENIPFNRLGDIKRLAKYTPEDLYVITKQKLSDRQRVKIEKEHFKILDAHNGISDDKIISIMKLYKSKPDMILISSDADFVKEVSRYIKNNRLQWIVADVNKKGIIMKVNIGSSNLSISTLAQRNKSTYYTKSKKYKRSNAHSANIKSKYGSYQYYQYFHGVLVRKYRTFIDYFKIILIRYTNK